MVSDMINVNLRDFTETINSTKIKTLAQLKESMDLSWVESKDYRVIDTVEGVQWVADNVKSAGFYAFDTEATGLNIYNMSRDNPDRDYLVGMCISWEEDQGVYIPLEHKKFSNAPKRETFHILKDVLENVPCVTHNGVFDGKVMYAEGIKLNIQHDTLHMLFSIDSDIHHFRRGLKHIIEYLFGYTPIEFEDIFEYEKDYRLFRFVDKDVARIYGCSDADGTLKSFNKLVHYLQKVHYRGYKKHIQLIPHIIRSEYEGKTIDMNLLQHKSDINRKDLENVQNIIFKYVGAELCYRKTGTIGNQVYKFNINSNPELGNVLFNKLDYPRKSDRGLDKAVLKWWASTGVDDDQQIDVVSNEIFKDDILSCDGETILLKRNTLLFCKYRLSLLIQLYRKLAKNQGSFFDPLLLGTADGKYFSSVNLCRAATYRMIDVIQTLDKGLKKAVAPPDDCYQIGYDYCQIEARCMIGLSGHKEYIDMLNNPEADYHTIAAAIIEKIRPIDVTKEQRGLYKPVNFGLPYGIGAKSMLEQGRGIGLSPEEYKKVLAETVDAIAKWKVGMAPVWNMLEQARDEALTPLESEDEKPFYYRGKSVGRVISPYGRARYFLLDNLTESGVASIRRKAGNFPIQSFAFDIYIEGIIKLGKCLEAEGLMDIKVPDDYSPLGYHFENKVVFREYVHDEVQMTISKDINPRWMMKMIRDNCIIHIEGHPTYYIGCSIVKNWGESKAGDHEVPYAWLESLGEDIEKYGGYNDAIQGDIDKESAIFIKKRTIEEWAKLGIDIETTEEMSIDDYNRFESYYLVGKMCDYYSEGRRKSLNKNVCGYNDTFIASMEIAFGHPIKITGAKAVKVESPGEKQEDTEQTDIVMLDYTQLWSMFADDMDEDYDITEDTETSNSEVSSEKKPVTYSDNFQKSLNIFNNLLGGNI